MGDALNTIDATTIDRHVRRLTAIGPRHADRPAAVAATLRYLTDCLTGYGYQVRPDRYGGGPHQVNLLAELPGTGDAPILELGAHWDTVVDSPGADDNASGVAGLLEVARVLRAAAPPARTLRFCLFAEEEDLEIGYLGSRAHVAGFDAAGFDAAGFDAAGFDAAGTPVAGAIVLEMIGYRDRTPGSQRLPADVVPADSPMRVFDRGDFIAAIGNPGADGYLEAVRAAGQAQDPPLPVLPITLPVGPAGNGIRSDHYPYWLSGRPAVMVTDTAEFRNPHYHRPGDTVTTLDLDFAAAVTRAVATAVTTLCGS